MHFDRHDIVARGKAVGGEGKEFGDAFVRLVGGESVVGEGGGHAQGTDLGAIEIIDGPVVNVIGREEGEVGETHVPLEVSAVIDRDLAAIRVRGRNVGIKQIRVFGGGCFVTEKAGAAAPGGVVVADLEPGGAEVGAAGVAVFPVLDPEYL